MSATQNHSARFHLTRKILVSILLLGVMVTSVLVYVYYSIGVTSVTGVTIDQVLADRKILNGTFPNRNATYLFEIRMWSTTEYLSVSVEKPIFVVAISGVDLGYQTMDTGTIYPGGSLVYNLRFAANESRVGSFYYTADPVVLKMATRLTSGFYSQSATICDSIVWNWTTALITANGGSSNHCTI